LWRTAAAAVFLGAFGTGASFAGEPPGPAATSVGGVGYVGQAAVPPHITIGKHTIEGWREEVDEYWGPGMAAAEQLSIFDQAWDELDRNYGAFVNLEIDMEALRRRYRPEIAAGVSKGRLAAILNHLSFAMLDAHTVIMRRSVNWNTIIRSGTPMLVIGGWNNNASFGASLTPMPDGSLLVLRTSLGHPLGLELGDLVLGYDGVAWRDLYPQLLAAELPIRQLSSWGSTHQSLEHGLLISAGLNWHLFDTIDIRKVGSDEVVNQCQEKLSQLS